MNLNPVQLWTTMKPSTRKWFIAFFFGSIVIIGVAAMLTDNFELLVRLIRPEMKK